MWKVYAKGKETDAIKMVVVFTSVLVGLIGIILAFLNNTGLKRH
jgi:hypothetical protein